MRADEQTRAAVNGVLTRMAAAIENKDIDALMKLFANDSSMLNIGPEEDEMSLGPARLKERFERDFTQAEAISIKYGYTSIRANGPVAWVASHVYYTIKKHNQPELNLSTRLTGVMEKIDDQWLWVQQHFSVPRNIEEGIAQAFKKIEADKAEAAKAAAAKAQAEQTKAAAPPEEAAKVEQPEGEQAKGVQAKGIQAAESEPAEAKPAKKIDDVVYEFDEEDED